MLLASQAIAQYYQAVESDDKALAAKLLESLEDEVYQNMSDWALIRKFCEKHKLYTRLELITKGLIKSASVVSSRPYLVLATLLLKSGRVDEARPFVKSYTHHADANAADIWEIGNLLYQAGSYEESLEIFRLGMQKSPGNFSCAIMEIRTLWKMREHRLARKKLRILLPLLATAEAWAWGWFVSVAFELREPTVAVGATQTLLSLLECGKVVISKGVVNGLKSGGEERRVREFIDIADPKNYCQLAELVDVFELAVKYGSHHTAKTFGAAILNEDSAHDLRPEIERLLVAPDFLMS